MSERKAIRNGVISRLTGSTAAGTNVHNSRVIPKKLDDLPAINVYFESEEHELLTQRSLRATPTLAIDCLVASSSTWQDDLDDLVDSVQDLLLGDSTFCDLVGNYRRGSLVIAYNGEGEVPFGFGTWSLELEHQLEFEPTVTDAFTTAVVNVDMIEPFDSNTGSSGPDGTIDVSLDVNPEQ